MNALSSSLSPIRTITGFDCQNFSFEKALLRRHRGLEVVVEFEKLSLIRESTTRSQMKTNLYNLR
jgi:hypothetical protein